MLQNKPNTISLYISDSSQYSRTKGNHKTSQKKFLKFIQKMKDKHGTGFPCSNEKNKVLS